jgi:hypothetical protein
MGPSPKEERPRFGQALFCAVAVLTAASGALLSWGWALTKSCELGIVTGLPVMAAGGLCYLAAIALTGYGLAVRVLAKQPAEFGRWPVRALWLLLAPLLIPLLVALLAPWGLLLLPILAVILLRRRKAEMTPAAH